MDPDTGRAVPNYKIIKDNTSSYNVIAPGRQAPQSQRPVRPAAGGRQTYTDKDLEDIRAAEIEMSKYRQGDYKIGRDNSSSYDLLRHDFQPTNSRAAQPSPFDQPRPRGDARPAKVPAGYGGAGAGAAGPGKAWTVEFSPAKAPARPAKVPAGSGNAKPARAPARAPAAAPFAKKTTGNNMAAKKPTGSRF